MINPDEWGVWFYNSSGVDEGAIRYFGFVNTIIRYATLEAKALQQIFYMGLI